MLGNKAYKFRIYPNKKQEILIAKTIGYSRYAFIKESLIGQSNK